MTDKDRPSNAPLAEDLETMRADRDRWVRTAAEYKAQLAEQCSSAAQATLGHRERCSFVKRCAVCDCGYVEPKR